MDVTMVRDSSNISASLVEVPPETPLQDSAMCISPDVDPNMKRTSVPDPVADRSLSESMDIDSGSTICGSNKSASSSPEGITNISMEVSNNIDSPLVPQSGSPLPMGKPTATNLAAPGSRKSETPQLSNSPVRTQPTSGNGSSLNVISPSQNPPNLSHDRTNSDFSPIPITQTPMNVQGALSTGSQLLSGHPLLWSLPPFKRNSTLSAPVHLNLISSSACQSRSGLSSSHKNSNIRVERFVAQNPMITPLRQVNPRDWLSVTSTKKTNIHFGDIGSYEPKYLINTVSGLRSRSAVVRATPIPDNSVSVIPFMHFSLNNLFFYYGIQRGNLMEVSN